MSFMLKKKKYKFKVDLVLQEISAVSFANGILFAKIRLTEGGTFTEMSQKLVIFRFTIVNLFLLYICVTLLLYVVTFGIKIILKSREYCAKA